MEKGKCSKSSCLHYSHSRFDSFGLMEKMLNEGILPDSLTFNLFLQDLCDVKRSADEMTYRILLSGYRSEAKRKEGQVLVNDMLDKGFISDLAAYNRLMDVFSSCKHIKRVDAMQR